MSSAAYKQIETSQNRAAEAGTGPQGVDEWVSRTRLAAEQSKTWYDSELSRQWERAYRMFNSQHPPGSKYFSDDYKYRSRLFRPKTRVAIRKNESRAAVAFFGTNDVVNIGADDGGDKKQQASADFYKSMMNIRLTRTIPWFKVCMGSYQTAEITGVCFAKVFWSYRAQTEVVTKRVTDPLTGAVMEYQADEIRVIEDKPKILPIPPENVRIHRAASWLNPIEDSPFIQVLWPMFAGDVRAMTQTIDPKTGQPQWRNVSESQIRNASRYAYNAVRVAREGERRGDPKDDNSAIADHEICWIIENIERIDGKDSHWYTLGEEALLSEAKPLTEVYVQGRPFVMGNTNLEAFKTYPAGKPDLGEGLQHAANEIQNLRIDNVKYAMQGRPIVKRGRNIDLRQVARHISGSPILVTALDDIEFDRPQDVTRSAYEEQNFLNADHDDIMGSFSPGSVNTNRRLSETVGGMELMSTGAEQIGDYDLRVFAETFVEPCMVLLLKVLQHYETDTAMMLKAADDAQIVMRYGVSEIDDEILDANLTLSVNVGIGQTDPMKRLEKFILAAKTSAEFVTALMGPEAATVINIEEHVNEFFGLSGYKDGSRFYKFSAGADPMIEAMKKKLDELMGALQQAEAGNQAKIEVATIGAKKSIAQEEIKARSGMAQLLAQIDQARRELVANTAVSREKLDIEREKIASTERTARQANATTVATAAVSAKARNERPSPQ